MLAMIIVRSRYVTTYTRASLSFLMLLSLFLGQVSAAASISHSRLTAVDFEVDVGNGNTQTLQLIKLLVDFNETIYLKHQDERKTLNDIPGLINGYPILSQVAAGTANVNCGGMVIPPYDPSQKNNGPPNGYVVSPPSSDPTYSLLGYIFQAGSIDEQTFDNRWAMTFPNMMQPLSPQQLNGFSCTVEFKVNNNGVSIVNHLNQVILM